MIGYEDFRTCVLDRIRDYLPPQYQDADIQIEQVIKNNGKEMYALIVRPFDTNVTPAIYMEQYYEEYQEGVSFSTILGEISETVYTTQKSREQIESDSMDLTSFEYCKDKIVMALINLTENAETLEHAPYSRMEDLAVIYRIQVMVPGDNVLGSVMVNDALMDKWGVTLEEVDAAARENSLRLLPGTCQSMMEALMGFGMMEGMSEEAVKEMMADTVPMYVISNSSAVNGASVILYTDILDQLSSKLGENLYILPSSLHEVLAIPESLGNPEELTMMVQSINATEVKQEDRLSDHVYHYDAAAKTLTLADTTVEELGIVAEDHKTYHTEMAEARQQEGETEGGQTARRSAHR